MSRESRKGRRVSGEALFLAMVIWALAVGAVIYGIRNWFPPLASEHGAGIDRMMHYLLLTAGALFVAGHLVLGYVILRSTRQGRVAVRLVSPRIERRWALIPAIIMVVIAEGGVLVLGLPVWGKFYGAPPSSGLVTIEVTGEQFGWNVRYPGADGILGRTDPRLMSLDNPVGLDRSDPAARDDLLLLGAVYLPLDRPVRVHLRSKDVLHSFFLPNFRVKQDAVPGMTIDFWFVPTRTGTFEIACAELCGFAHYNMRGVLYVVSEDEFRQWLASEPPFFS
ncbi:MAG: cytochrome-c oxidase [Acidobacteria bacterium]|nr:cytochrome-c oxidase [Acidobacteriota bacterium]